jgi:hypothetical protein
MFFLVRYECPKFQDNMSPNFGTLDKKCHLNVTLTESHKIYCKEGSGASSQKLQAV